MSTLPKEAKDLALSLDISVGAAVLRFIEGEGA
jgi:hypothetical protein